MTTDTINAAFEALEREECLRLAASQSVGRLAVTVDDHASPLVVPVNYVLDRDVVVFRSGPGAKLHALRETPVSFEVDLIDASHRTGWSVLFRGIAYQATDREVAHLLVEPWAPGDKQHWIRVLPTAITGRSIRLPDVPWETRGYR
jgi:nitroimidazol reductase NimA-like FMN-containing flavoprotein (pyridoxamine 5'-phosphate oxidase superfamily)